MLWWLQMLLMLVLIGIMWQWYHPAVVGSIELRRDLYDAARWAEIQQSTVSHGNTGHQPPLQWWPGRGIAGNLPHKEVNKDIRSGGTGLAAGTTCAETRKKTDQVICVHLAAIIRDQGYNRLTFLPLFRNIAPPCLWWEPEFTHEGATERLQQPPG